MYSGPPTQTSPQSTPIKHSQAINDLLLRKSSLTILHRTLSIQILLSKQTKKLHTTNQKQKYTNPTQYQHKHRKYQSLTREHQSITKKEKFAQQGHSTVC